MSTIKIAFLSLSPFPGETIQMPQVPEVSQDFHFAFKRCLMDYICWDKCVQGHFFSKVLLVQPQIILVSYVCDKVVDIFAFISRRRPKRNRLWFSALNISGDIFFHKTTPVTLQNTQKMLWEVLKQLYSKKLMVKPLDPLTQINKCSSALGYFISQISASLYSGGK